MPRQPVEIVETHEFQKNYKNFISEVELDAIRYLLAAKPSSGEPIDGLLGLFRLDWRPGSVYVVYMVSTTSCTVPINEQGQIYKLPHHSPPLPEEEGGCGEGVLTVPLSVEFSTIIHLITIGSTPPEPNGGTRKIIADLIRKITQHGIYIGVRETVIMLYKLLDGD